MSAVESAETAAEATRQLCHDLYRPQDIHEIYSTLSTLVEVRRQLGQAIDMLTGHVERLDPARHYDDRGDTVAGAVAHTLAGAHRLMLLDDLVGAQNALSHVGVAR